MSFDPFTAGFDLVKTALDKIFPDADLELKGKLEQAAAQVSNEYNIQLAQLKINETEAASSSFFVAGARPAVMWIGVLSLFYNGILASVLTWIGQFYGWPPLPVITDSVSSDVLMGLLGVSGLRTIDKINGVVTKRIK